MIFGGRGLGFADKAPKHQGEAAGNTSRSIEVIMTRDIAMHRAIVAAQTAHKFLLSQHEQRTCAAGCSALALARGAECFFYFSEAGARLVTAWAP